MIHWFAQTQAAWMQVDCRERDAQVNEASSRQVEIPDPVG